MDLYVVRSGETLFSVAQRTGISAEFLAALNGLPSGAPLIEGQALVLRYPQSLHTVTEGETLFSIARQYGLSVRTLYQNNFMLSGRPDIVPGQTLVLSFADRPLRTLSVNAYAYPHISGALLNAALPYLTYLTPFTYGVASDGTLVPLSDDALRTAAARHRTAVWMHLSTLTESGNFSSERAAAVLDSPQLQSILISNVLQAIQQKGYSALDVDFEYIPPRLREAYAAFIAALRDALAPFHCPVIVALAPKTDAAQRGLLYEAHDYALLGAAASAVFLMTYEWGYTYGPPMAVAPLPNVRAVLDYAVREIAPGKIFLGIPLYGYDWALPFVQGETKAESLSPVQAMERAFRFHAPIHYDETAQAPYYSYAASDGREHIVWFEDARSARAKLLLAGEYGLPGIGCWSLMRDFPQFWTVLNGLYDIEPLI